MACDYNYYTNGFVPVILHFSAPVYKYSFLTQKYFTWNKICIWEMWETECEIAMIYFCKNMKVPKQRQNKF